VRLFLVTFLLAYILMHAYAFFRIKAALSLSTKMAVSISVFMAVMVLSPFIIHYAERQGLEFFARLMSYTGYLWMGELFLFVSASFAFDIYRMILSAVNSIFRRDPHTIIPSAQLSFFISLLFSITACAYGYFDAKDIRTEHLTVTSSRISRALKIVQISDVHIGLIVRGDRVRKIMDIVRTANPDILVSTGDLVDGQINGLEGIANILNEINPGYGKFAITGNHEFYAGLGQALSFTEKAGFRILREEAVDVGGINIAGVDDPASNIYGLSRKVSEKELLSGLDPEKFTLLLKHRPLADKNAAGLFDLQLSGHTHKGQIFPFSLITKIYYPSHAGLSSLPGNSLLYVSRGAGTWGPPVRFLSPPEVTVIDLVPLPIP